MRYPTAWTTPAPEPPRPRPWAGPRQREEPLSHTSAWRPPGHRRPVRPGSTRMRHIAARWCSPRSRKHIEPDCQELEILNRYQPRTYREWREDIARPRCADSPLSGVALEYGDDTTRCILGLIHDMPKAPPARR